MMKHVLHSILGFVKGVKLNISQFILGLKGDTTSDYREMLN